MQIVFDDTHCMRPSYDTNVDSPVDLDTLRVVDLDTSIMPVFGLRAFDQQLPVVCMLPGDFSNTIECWCGCYGDAGGISLRHH